MKKFFLVPLLFFCFSYSLFATGRKGICGAQLEQELQSPPRHIPRNFEFKAKRGTITYEEMLHQYARLMLKVGINIKKGDNVFMTANVEHFSSPDNGPSLIEIIAEEAYAMGAKYFHAEPMEGRLQAIRADFGNANDANYVSGLTKSKYKQLVDSMKEGEDRWSRIVLGPSPEVPPALNRSTEQRDALLGAITQGISTITQDYFAMLGAKEFPWLVVAAPTFDYSQRVFAHTNEAPIVKYYRTWALYMQVLGLDRADPAAYWKNLNKLAANRSKNLNSMQATELHFKSKDGLTDLRVGLIEDVKWTASADDSTPDGRSMMANIPSVEIFTSPHRFKVNGRMQSSTPVVINGLVIENLWLEFENGQVVNHGASQNAHVISNLFLSDPRFRYAGEIALVDVKSPVNEAGVTFFNTLFDENRAMHLALGSAYPMNMKHLTKEQREAMGFNSSIFHFDLMFGSEQVDVDAVGPSGNIIPVMRNGSFVGSFNEVRN